MQNKGKLFQVQLFQGVEPGFALRGDTDNPYERKSLKEVVDSSRLTSG